MYTISVLALGYNADDMTLRAVNCLKNAQGIIILRTEKMGAAEWLRGEGISYTTLDSVYEETDDFDELNEALVQKVLQKAEEADVYYCVPDLRDIGIKQLMEHVDAVHVISGVPVEGLLAGYIENPCCLVSASDWESFAPEASLDTLVREIDSAALASEIKLRLMERYPEEHNCLLWNGTTLQSISLCDLDRQEKYDHLTSLFVPAQKDLTKLERYGFNELNRVIRILRAPGGCPWDRAQTHESLRNDLLEEAYEAVDTIDRDDLCALYDELGDVMLQIALHAEIARQHGEFTIDDITSAITEKMIARHTHIFGSAHAETADEVMDLWSKNKQKERELKTVGQDMQTIARSLPGLMRAKKILKKAQKADGTAPELAEAVAKAVDSLNAITEASEESTVGDALLCVVDIVRALHMDGEVLLNAACDRVIEKYKNTAL